MGKEKTYKTLQDANLSDDFLFSKTFADPGVCKAFLEELLQIKISELSVVEAQKILEATPISKGVRLDIKAKEENGTMYDIEMQNYVEESLGKRSRYYQSMIDIDALEKGTEYDKLSPSYVIFICTYDPFDKGKMMYTFKTMCVEDSHIKFDDECCKIVLNTKGLEQNVNPEVSEFLKYVESTTDSTAENSCGSLVKFVHKRVLDVKKNRMLRRDYMTYEELYKRAETAGFRAGMSKGKAAGRAEGIAEGRAEGIAEGRAEGIAEGRAEGRAEEQKNIAKKMREEGIEISSISKILGMSEEEIENL